nr:hypothetical protein [Nocardia amikacinitolerans]
MFEDDVRVGSADTEAGYRGTAGTAGGWPGDVPGEEFDAAITPGHVRGWGTDAQALGHCPVPHGLNHFDDSRHSRRGRRVTQVRLHRAESQRRRIGPTEAVGGQQRVGLDRVAEPGSGAVRLDDIDVVDGEPGVRECPADDALLGRAVGRGQSIGCTVLVDCATANEGVDVAPIANGVRKSFQYQDSGALTENGAVGVVGEGLAATVGGERTLPGELDVQLGAAHNSDAGGEGEVAFARTQRRCRLVYRDQRRRAGGVDRKRGSLQTEHICESAGDDTDRVAGEAVALRIPVAGSVMLRESTGKNSRVATAQ